MLAAVAAVEDQYLLAVPVPVHHMETFTIQLQTRQGIVETANSRLCTVTKHGVHGVSCSAHVFAQKQHFLRTFVRTFTTHLNPGPTPPHSRLSDPELLQQLIFTAPPALASVSTLSTS